MRLGPKFTLTTSTVVAIVIAVYGYQTISTRRRILVSRMKREVRAIARTARIYIEEAPTLEGQDLRTLVDGIGEFEKTLGVFVELNKKALQSGSLQELPHSLEKNLKVSKQVIAEGEVTEGFSRYGKASVFTYFEPLRAPGGEVIGSMGIIQHTSFLEKDIWATTVAVAMTMVVLIALIVASILFLIRFNVTGPISELVKRIRKVARRQFDSGLLVSRNDELGELAQEFNQMAGSLKEAEEHFMEERDKKAELEQRMRHLERLATIGQLASGLAHEIGTPLNVISGRAGYLRKRVDDRESVGKNLDIIMRQSQRITKIIKQLLSVSRKESARFIPTELPPAIDSALELLEYRIRKQGIEIIKEFSEDLPLVEGNPEQLQQVFLNLIHNAVQAMPNGGALVVEGRVIPEKEVPGQGLRRDLVKVRVKDTGSGMKPETLQNIFKPFFTTKGDGRGTGLGLPIAYGIVTDHKGRIAVDSEEGKGTTVEISFPATVNSRT